MSIDIVIPIHIPEFKLLEKNLNSIKIQTFNNYNIIITDETNNNDIHNFVLKYNKINNLPIYFYKSPKKGWSNNHNNGLKYCQSNLIKILHYDNYFYNENSLLEIVNEFKKNKNINWLVTSYLHNKNDIICNLNNPYYNTNILSGLNTIGDPSCLTFKNENIIFFDTNLTWFVDCEYYYRLYNLYGDPHILNTPNIVVRHHDKQTTHSCENNLELINYEKNYIKIIYNYSE